MSVLGGTSAGRCRGRSAKFVLILTTRYQYWGVDPPNLNSSWPLCHCVHHPWKLTSIDYWSSRNEWQPLSKLKHVLRKCSGVSQKWWMLELSNLCHYVQLPWKLTSGYFWSSRNDRKPLSQQKCVLRKCCGESQKWWVLELSNLWHCVQLLWKLTSRDFWSCRNESGGRSAKFELILTTRCQYWGYICQQI